MLHGKISVLLLIGMLAVVLLGAGYVAAQEEAAEDELSIPAQPARKAISLLGMVKGGGWVGLLIIVMSLVSAALVVEHFFTINRNKLIPPDLVEEVQRLLDAKDYGPARKVCEESDSLVAQAVAAGLGQLGSMFGFLDMQTAIQEVSERYVGRLYRKLAYLSFIAMTAPMLGLFGTVTGMMASFNTIAEKAGKANPSDLAQGISEALTTTCFGLAVAIPAMFFVAVFRNRVEGIVAESEAVVERLMGRFKQGEKA